MPAVIGTFKAVSVSGVLDVGDVIAIAPKDTGKSYAGSGTFNTGDVARTFNLLSTTNTIDLDAVDTNIRTLV